MAAAKTTTDHEKIKTWAESRGGRPARVKTGKNGSSLLRFDFDEPDERLEPIEWQEFFDVFEKNKLALLFQEETEDKKVSRFNKIIARRSN
jgi:hypothetical protein